MNHPPVLSRILARSFDVSPDLRCRPLTDGVTDGSWLGHGISRRLNGDPRNAVDLHRFPDGLIRCITDSVNETTPSGLPLLPDGSRRATTGDDRVILLPISSRWPQIRTRQIRRPSTKRCRVVDSAISAPPRTARTSSGLEPPVTCARLTNKPSLQHPSEVEHGTIPAVRVMLSPAPICRSSHFSRDFRTYRDSPAEGAAYATKPSSRASPDGMAAAAPPEPSPHWELDTSEPGT